MVMVVGLFSNLVYADIFDRIDICEKAGGGACVYNLLRELAKSGGSGGGELADFGGTYTRVDGGTHYCEKQLLQPKFSGSTLDGFRLECIGSSWYKNFECREKWCGPSSYLIKIESIYEYKIYRDGFYRARYQRIN